MWKTGSILSMRIPLGIAVLVMVGGIVLFFVGLVWFSGSGDYAVELPGGYRLVRTNASTVTIWSPRLLREGELGHCVVPPKVTRIGVQGALVFGLVEVSPQADAGLVDAPGYFVLDTPKEEVLLKLDKEKWLQALKERGLTEEPDLKKPSRWLKVATE